MDWIGGVLVREGCGVQVGGNLIGSQSWVGIGEEQLVISNPSRKKEQYFFIMSGH